MIRVLVLLLTVLAAVTPLSAQLYTFALVDCGSYGLHPKAINNAGVVVGEAQTSGVNHAFGFAFTVPNGPCQFTPADAVTSFLGISNAGEIFGLYTQTQDYMLYKGVTSPAPNYPGAYASYTSFKNANGVIGGNYLTSAFELDRTGFFYQHGQFWSFPPSGPDGSWTLTGLNDAGVAVGTFYGLKEGGFIMQNKVVQYLSYPGAKYTSFNGINNRGLIVGTFSSTMTGEYGVFTYDMTTQVWTDCHFPLEYDAAWPVGITDSGLIAAEPSATGGLMIATPVGN